jgi:hypothetical protein
LLTLSARSAFCVPLIRLLTHCPVSRRQALGLLTGACLCARSAWTQESAAEATATLYFYSPETNLNNFGLLKGEFDSFFSGSGGHKFQPFSDRATFEAVLRENRPGLYFMSSWHYAQFANKNRWTPLLIGSLKRKSTQRHVLCARKNGLALSVLGNSTIASAGKREFTASLLSDLLSTANPGATSNVKVLEVPKDMDALMAVSFGAAQAAVATEVGLEKLRTTNSKQHDLLTPPLTIGPERLLPVIVAAGTPDAATRSLIGVLAGMGADLEGQQRLRLLGLDAWTPVEESQLKELRK